MKCDLCNFDSKAGPREKAALAKHRNSAHADGVKGAPAMPHVEVQAPSDEVTFFSPRLPFLTVVVKPTEWSQQEGPAGTKWYPVEGIMVEFDNGYFKTSDPATIAYLEGDRAKAKELGLLDKKGQPRVYDDPKFPILSTRQMHALGEKRA